MTLNKIGNLTLKYQFGLFFASSTISSLDVGHVSFVKPVRLNRLLTQYEESKYRHFFKCSSRLLAINAFAVVTTTTVFTTPPFLLST